MTPLFWTKSLEKPNAGKPVLQMRVYILFFSNEILYKEKTGILLYKTPDINSLEP